MKIKLLGCIFFFQLGCVYAQLKVDTLADKMLQYQLSNGAWSKQLGDKSVVDYKKTIDQDLKKRITATSIQSATIDNNATTREIKHLIQAYRDTQNPSYLKAAQSGIAYLLEMQYPNGGFPQYYPNKALYRGQITFNDNAMINALTILYQLAKRQAGYEDFPEVLRKRAEMAVERGISCILKTQVKQAGTRSIWAAQYDPKTLQPAKARNFEPASLSSSESSIVVRFLMDLESPSPEIISAVKAAKVWFEQHDIEGYRFDYTVDPQTQKPLRALIPDPDTNIWARFYEIESNRPIFGDRDNSIKYDFNELSAERRNGYAWFGTWGTNFVSKEYPKWIKKNNIQE